MADFSTASDLDLFKLYQQKHNELNSIKTELELRLSKSRAIVPAKEPCKSRVLVSFPHSTTQAQLENTFGRYGRINAFKLLSPGRAQITYDDGRDAWDAIAHLDGTHDGGGIINVKIDP